MYKAHAAHLWAIAFVIYLAAAVIAALLALAGNVGVVLGELVAIIAAFLVQATLVKAVQDVRDGRADLSIGETVSAATPYIWPVAGASILAGIAITIGLILFIVPGLYLITIWAVIVPVIVLERSGVFASFGRSYRLVRGHGWHVFGTLVLVFIIMIAVSIVLGLIFSVLPYVWRSGLSSIISGTLIAPFLALVVTLVYYRLAGDSQASPPVSGESYGAYPQPPHGGGPYGGSPPPQQGGGPYGGSPPPPQGGSPYGDQQPAAGGEAYGRPQQAPFEAEAHRSPPQAPAEDDAYRDPRQLRPYRATTGSWPGPGRSRRSGPACLRCRSSPGSGRR